MPWAAAGSRAPEEGSLRARGRRLTATSTHDFKLITTNTVYYYERILVMPFAYKRHTSYASRKRDAASPPAVSLVSF